MEIITYQKPRLVYLFKKRNIKFNIKTKIFFEKPEYNNGGNDIGNQKFVYILPLIRFNQ
jgi:hypothetical protein